MAYFSITFRAFVPVTIRYGWAWEPWTGQDPVGTERLADLSELPRLLRTYGRALSVHIRPEVGNCFNVTAYGAKSNRVYGRDQWLWDTEFRVFRAHGWPWVPDVSTTCVTKVLPASVPAGAIDVSALRQAA